MKEMLHGALTLAGVGAVLCLLVAVLAVSAADNPGAALLGVCALAAPLLVVVGLQLAGMAYSKQRLDEIRDGLDKLTREGAR